MPFSQRWFFFRGGELDIDGLGKFGSRNSAEPICPVVEVDEVKRGAVDGC